VIRYAAHAVPWGLVGVVAVLVLTMMEFVGRWPWQTWALEGAAVGLLAGAAAWCFDEPAAAVVDPAPRSLGWRTLARGSGVLVLATVWVVAVARAWDSLFGHPWVVALHGVAALVAGAAWATWRRAAGAASPGMPLAISVVPLLTGWALVRPLGEHLPVFPYSPEGDWGASLAAWGCLLVAAVALLVAALADAPWWRVRSAAASPALDLDLAAPDEEPSTAR
jgi:hypothetical protein